MWMIDVAVMVGIFAIGAMCIGWIRTNDQWRRDDKEADRRRWQRVSATGCPLCAAAGFDSHLRPQSDNLTGYVYAATCRKCGYEPDREVFEEIFVRPAEGPTILERTEAIARRLSVDGVARDEWQFEKDMRRALLKELREADPEKWGAAKLPPHIAALIAKIDSVNAAAAAARTNSQRDGGSSGSI